MIETSEFKLTQIYRKIEKTRDLLGENERESIDILGDALAELNRIMDNGEEEIVTVGIEVRFSGARKNVDMAIENLAQDAETQSMVSKVEVDVREPVDIEAKIDEECEHR